MARHPLAVLCAASLLVAVAVPAAGSVPSAPAAPALGRRSCTLAKTRFALHAGLAFGAFHRYISKPAKAGEFHGPHKVKALIKAGAAALFAAHEAKVAYGFAQCSRLLRPLLSPLGLLAGSLLVLGPKLKAGHDDPAAIAAAGQSADSVSKQSSTLGAPIKDR